MKESFKSKIVKDFQYNGRRIGFDTSHFYNYETPKTKSLEYVEKQCKKIVDELNANFSFGSQMRLSE